nr:hypothetical protein CFP56_53883 [Quercus suber]
MSPSVHGSSGPSGRIRSKQQRPGDPVERERRSKCKLDPRKGKSQSSGEDVKAHYPPKLASLGSFQRQNRRRWGPSPEFLT